MSATSKHKLLSIIVPIYNASEHITTALSFFSETIIQNVQFIFVNDGSTDNSIEILKNFMVINEALGFNYEIIETSNKGVSSARNTGLKYAKGKFIMFLDADDSFNMKPLKSIIHYLVNNNCNFFVSSYRGVECHFNDHEVSIKCPEVNFSEFKELYLKGELVKYVSLCSCVYERGIIESASIQFNENIHFGEDQLFVIQYLQCVKHAFIKLDTPVLNYLQHDASVTKSFNYKRFDAIKMLEIIKANGYSIGQSDLNSRINKELVGIGTLFYKANNLASSILFFQKNIKPVLKSRSNRNLYSAKDFVFIYTPLFYIFMYKIYLKVLKK